MELIARVFVTPKQAVLDPQGQAIASSLHALGYKETKEVRLGKYILIHLSSKDLSQARERVEAMCRQLLANEIIEDFRFELEVAGR